MTVATQSLTGVGQPRTLDQHVLARSVHVVVDNGYMRGIILVGDSGARLRPIMLAPGTAGLDAGTFDLLPETSD